MGHIHLATLAKTRAWAEVIAAIAGGASVISIAGQSAKAAERDLGAAARDPVFIEAVRLVLSIPLAARQVDFANALRMAGLDVSGNPSLMDIVMAVTSRLDTVAKSSPAKTDFAELATRSATSALVDCIGSDLPALFGPTAEDVRLSCRKFSYSAGIAVLTRTFFGVVVSTSLSYWLDRVLAHHIGDGRRFANVGERADFDRSLQQYTSEVTRIIQEFSGGWYGKTVYEKGGIGHAEARDFGYVSLKKITEELRVRRGDG